MTQLVREKSPSGTRALFASPAVRSMFARNNLAELDAIFERGAAARHRHAGRSVWDVHLVDDEGEDVHVYAKMNWGRQRLWPRMTDLKTGQWLQPLPVREWHGIAALERLGLNVPRRLALLHQGIVSFRAVVLVRAIPPAASVGDLLRSGEWQRLASEQRGDVLRGMAAVMRTIHAAGLGWRGTSVGHFYPQWTAEGNCRLWIIDCEGVHRRASRKTIARDDRKLTRSFQLADADQPTLSLLSDALHTAAPADLSRAA